MKQLVFYAVVALAVFAYYKITGADRDDSGAIVSAGDLDAFSIKVGDCFDDVDSDSITSLPAVPCGEPHDNEVYATFNVSLSTFPGAEAMQEMAFTSCKERFEPFVGKPYDTSSLDIFPLTPTSESWAQSDREIVCAVYDMEEKKLVGSVKNRGV